MFEAHLTQGVILRKIIEVIAPIVPTVNIQCRKDGLFIVSMCESHTTMIHLHLESEGWTRYKCDHQMTLGVNLDQMLKILKSARNEDSITLSADDDADKLKFTFESPKKDLVTSWNLKLMDIQCEVLDFPDIEFDAVASFDSAEFKRILTSLKDFGDSTEISLTPKNIKFAVDGESGAGNFTLQGSNAADEEDGLQLDVKNDASGVFLTRTLLNFCKAATLSRSVDLRMSEKVPALLAYNVEDKEGKIGQLKFFIAPKCDEEDGSDDEDDDNDDADMEVDEAL